MLKCPICGKEYSYDSKICKECEMYLEYSGLAKSTKKRGYKADIEHKWNCAAFLSDDRYVFAINKSPKLYMGITNEPSSLRIAPAKNHGWNCEKTERLRADIIKSFKNSDIPIEKELVDRIVDYVVKRSDSLLIYE